jgi:cell division protein FtsL
MTAIRPAGCSVFLVEDEVMIRMMVADMLGLVKISPLVSLVVTLAILAIGVIYSMYQTRNLGTKV